MQIKNFLIPFGVLILFFFIYAPLVISSTLPAWLICALVLLGAGFSGYSVIRFIFKEN